ncbi:hypothetical protein [Nocardioides sp. LHG3406-4]|uniref:hypothetical protein n=1 Tax=Nocardioides sp. LHG3406-4 TaxID=2804575 RepID=UPI003CFB1CDB
MSEQDAETPQAGIADEQLPEDLQPGEDNPLAEPLDPDDVDRDLEMDATQDPDGSEDSHAAEDADDSADGS